MFVSFTQFQNDFIFLLRLCVQVAISHAQRPIFGAPHTQLFGMRMQQLWQFGICTLVFGQRSVLPFVQCLEQSILIAQYLEIQATLMEIRFICTRWIPTHRDVLQGVSQLILQIFEAKHSCRNHSLSHFRRFRNTQTVARMNAERFATMHRRLGIGTAQRIQTFHTFRCGTTAVCKTMEKNKRIKIRRKYIWISGIYQTFLSLRFSSESVADMIV